MALVNGPLFSLDASGQVGKALVYTTWKGRKVVREYVTPANPRSLGQRWQRGLMGVMSTWWAALSSTNKDSWIATAAAKNISPFNEFLSYNLIRAESNTAPTGQLAATPVAPTGALTSWTATGGLGKITISITPTTTMAASDLLVVGLSIISNTDAQNYGHVVTGRTDGGVTNFAKEIVGLAAGTYYLSADLLSATGGADAWVNGTGSPVTVT